MTDEEYEFVLTDRIAKIQAINEQYDLENNSYVSFSGGKDSTILHYLVDMALPNNKIPRVFANTGIEYNDMVKFVKSMAQKDNRFIVLNQTENIKKTLEKYGYPFKSKEHAKKVNQYWNSKEITNYLDRYINPKNNGRFKTKYKCPEILLYQFTERNKLHISHLCCDKLKKNLVNRWKKENKKNIVLTGMRNDEGGQRANIKNCVLTDKNGKIEKFHPLLVVSNEFEKEFIKRNKIELCKLYYPPYNFERTGCKGCPFSLQLQKNLERIYIYMPNEYWQCIHLWKPVYDEYIRIGFRLKYYPHERGVQMNLFDFL